MRSANPTCRFDHLLKGAGDAVSLNVAQSAGGPFHRGAGNGPDLDEFLSSWYCGAPRFKNVCRGAAGEYIELVKHDGRRLRIWTRNAVRCRSDPQAHI